MSVGNAVGVDEGIRSLLEMAWYLVPEREFKVRGYKTLFEEYGIFDKR